MSSALICRTSPDPLLTEPRNSMEPAQIVEAVGLLAGVGLVTWQFRWLLRAYRAERDRQAPERRSPRLFVLALALMVFAVFASISNLYTARRIAVGAILIVGVAEEIRRRVAKEP
jgi:hypothetical protein